MNHRSRGLAAPPEFPVGGYHDTVRPGQRNNCFIP
jgi:hypothetical protein